MADQIKIVSGVAHRHVRAYFENEKGQRLPIPEVSMTNFNPKRQWVVNYTQDVDGLDVETAAKVYELFQAARNKIKELEKNPLWSNLPEEIPQ